MVQATVKHQVKQIIGFILPLKSFSFRSTSFKTVKTWIITPVSKTKKCSRTFFSLLVQDFASSLQKKLVKIKCFSIFDVLTFRKGKKKKKRKTVPSPCSLVLKGIQFRKSIPVRQSGKSMRPISFKRHFYFV